ncbi:toxin-antitoxin system YwqK family antitoxin [Pelobium sp.]|nr:toxin-antitoxin system YwqK family antitoxin [Pelobium sp.]MDA9555611.1 toxin-antitoxin system YwqK family antitoxin [Pelobium sp.]
MAQQVQFLSKLFIIMTLLSACSNSGSTPHAIALNRDSTQVITKGGITYCNGAPFTGKLYQLNPNHKDTISMQEYKNGKEDGCWKQFDEHQKLTEIRYFKDGLKDGTYQSWWENGKPKAQYSFKNGEYDGVFKEWQPNGKLSKEMHYQNGYEVGSQKVWYDNGKIRSNYQMINGRRYGLLGTKNCVNVSDSLFKK